MDSFAVLHKLRYRFLEQLLDILHARNICLAQQLSDQPRLASSSGVLFLPISFSSIRLVLLYTIYEVYTRFEMVSTKAKPTITLI